MNSQDFAQKLYICTNFFKGDNFIFYTIPPQMKDVM